MESSIRRYQSDLRISGTAVILFSAWSIFRYTVYLYTHSDLVKEWIAQNLGDEATQYGVMLVILGIMYGVVFGITLLINLYIGRCALRESRGQRGGWLYLLLSAGYLAATLLSLIPAFSSQDVLSGGLSVSAGLMVDASYTFAHVHLIYSAIRLRRLLHNKA